jgi:hypothetical protein
MNDPVHKLVDQLIDNCIESHILAQKMGLQHIYQKILEVAQKVEVGKRSDGSAHTYLLPD